MAKGLSITWTSVITHNILVNVAVVVVCPTVDEAVCWVVPFSNMVDPLLHVGSFC